jgi:Uma2 family endonuclease
LLLVPDAAFIAKGRVPEGEALRASFDGAPDLAVEVVSPTDRLTQLDEKARTWLRFGARMVWVLNPRQRAVVVWMPDGTVRTLGSGEVLPGFRIAVADLFGSRGTRQASSNRQTASRLKGPT